VIDVLGHDRIAGLRGFYRQKPILVVALVLSALSLVGVPPTGGFAGKWMLVMAAIAGGQWWWGAVILAGGLLAGGYMFRVLAPMLAETVETKGGDDVGFDAREAIVLALAVAALLMGCFPESLAALLDSGRPVFPGMGDVP
jgi:NADH:ubiquinone oxidoreductase subunit 2 (subunit N)